MAQKDSVRTTTKAVIKAHANVKHCIKLYKAIFNARRSNLFEAIINPDKLPRLINAICTFDKETFVSFSLTKH